MEVHSKLATNKSVMVNMDRQHRKKMAELTEHVEQRLVELTQSAGMDVCCCMFCSIVYE